MVAFCQLCIIKEIDDDDDDESWDLIGTEQKY